MRELLRDFGIVFSVSFLAIGTYLLHEAVSGSDHDGLASLILGSVLCALAGVVSLSSIKLHYSLRSLRNDVDSKN